MTLTIKAVLQPVLLGLILLLACDARQRQSENGPVKIERLTISNVEVTLNYFDQRLLPTDLYFINNPRRFDATSQRAIILKDMFQL